VTTPRLVDHFFRHEYGRLVALLSRRVGVEYIEDIEDAVQSALMRALETWTIAGLPDNQSAWLFRVAHNNLMGVLRQRTRRHRILERNAKSEVAAPENGPELFLAGEVQDDLLRLLFVCCHDVIPIESQLIFAVKTLCGFDVREIAIRLFSQKLTYINGHLLTSVRWRSSLPVPVATRCESESVIPLNHSVASTRCLL
jgi:predicted RNA polymerase sigma factor